MDLTVMDNLPQKKKAGDTKHGETVMYDGHTYMRISTKDACGIEIRKTTGRCAFVNLKWGSLRTLSYADEVLPVRIDAKVHQLSHCQ